MTAVREHSESIRYLSRREIAQERTDLFKVINGDSFFQVKTWPEDMRITFWQKPIGDVGTFKLVLFGLQNGCSPNLRLRWILTSQTWSPEKQKSGHVKSTSFSLPQTVRSERTVKTLGFTCVEVNQLENSCLSQVVFHNEFVHVVQCQSIKCKKQNHRYCASRAKLFTSGDIELNPGPVVTQGNNPNNLVALLQFQLVQHGLRILDVGGAGDCFFRVVSHQLYGEPSYHMNVRSTGVQYMRNNPERFIESSTDQSWLRYLAYMSHQGTWADTLVIQAVADALNLTIHIIESNPGFASVTNISPVHSETDTTVINIAHPAETHYVSTVPFNEEEMACNTICNNQPAQLVMGHYRTTINNETIAVTKEQKRKAYLKEYMATRRRNNEFRNKQNKALQVKRSENIEKKQENLKGRHFIDANNQILIISEN